MTSLLLTLYFVRSGNANIVSGGVWRPGVIGYDWGSRVDAVQDDAIGIHSLYALSWWNTGVQPSNGPLNAVLGLPLRCLRY